LRSAAAAPLPSFTDGVFANIPAKPDITAAAGARNDDGSNQNGGGDGSLPAYESVASDSVPAYNVAVILPGHSFVSVEFFARSECFQQRRGNQRWAAVHGRICYWHLKVLHQASFRLFDTQAMAMIIGDCIE
jgi:hypothetical protein